MLTAAQELVLDRSHPVRAAIDAASIAERTYDKWFDRGLEMSANGDVLAVDVSDTAIVGIVRSASVPGGYAVEMRLDSAGRLQASCDCPVHERHRILWCKHRVALALVLGHVTVPRRRPDGTFALPFPSGRDPYDVPVSWTLVAGSGAVRHLSRGGGGARSPRRPACGQAGEFTAATNDRPLCRRCVAKSTG